MARIIKRRENSDCPEDLSDESKNREERQYRAPQNRRKDLRHVCLRRTSHHPNCRPLHKFARRERPAPPISGRWYVGDETDSDARGAEKARGREGPAAPEAVLEPPTCYGAEHLAYRARDAPYREPIGGDDVSIVEPDAEVGPVQA